MHSALGYIVGWGMVMDYLLNPLICTAFCAKAAMNILPGLSFYAWIVFFAAFFTWVNLRGVKTSAQMNEALCAGMEVKAEEEKRGGMDRVGAKKGGNDEIHSKP